MDKFAISRRAAPIYNPRSAEAPLSDTLLNEILMAASLSGAPQAVSVPDARPPAASTPASVSVVPPPAPVAAITSAIDSPQEPAIPSLGDLLSDADVDLLLSATVVPIGATAHNALRQYGMVANMGRPVSRIGKG